MSLFKVKLKYFIIDAFFNYTEQLKRLREYYLMIYKILNIGKYFKDYLLIKLK